MTVLLVRLGFKNLNQGLSPKAFLLITVSEVCIQIRDAVKDLVIYKVNKSAVL